MSTNIKITNKIDANLPPIQILLAESDPLEIDRIIASIDRSQVEIEIVSNYGDLLARITKEEPQLLLLGRIDKSNYFDTCIQCHLICDRLPIVLLSKQGAISESFRQLAKDYGMRDVIHIDSVELHELFQTLDRPRYRQIATGQMMLTGLGEIVTVSNNYFGPLAQGNYWRKAHARIVDEFPFINNWSADHFSKIGCDESILDRVLTDRDIQSLRIWVQIFIEECERIIIDYRTILNDSDLSPPAKDLLTTSSPQLTIS